MKKDGAGFGKHVADIGEAMDFYDEYRQKLRTPEEAVKAIKNGDWVDYGTNVCFPALLDAALAWRGAEKPLSA